MIPDRRSALHSILERAEIHQEGPIANPRARDPALYRLPAAGSHPEFVGPSAYGMLCQ
jgi:hypothetical protein